MTERNASMLRLPPRPAIVAEPATGCGSASSWSWWPSPTQAGASSRPRPQPPGGWLARWGRARQPCPNRSDQSTAGGSRPYAPRRPEPADIRVRSAHAPTAGALPVHLASVVALAPIAVQAKPATDIPPHGRILRRPCSHHKAVSFRRRRPRCRLGRTVRASRHGCAGGRSHPSRVVGGARANYR